MFMLINNTRYRILEVLFSIPIEKEKRKEKKNVSTTVGKFRMSTGRRSNRSFKQIKNLCTVSLFAIHGHMEEAIILILC